MNYFDLLGAFVCACVFVLCNIGTKISLRPGSEWLMYPVYAGGMLAYWVFRRVCMNHGLAVSSGVVDSLVTITTIAIGIVFFSEHLIIKQYVGLAFIVIGLQLVR